MRYGFIGLGNLGGKLGRAKPDEMRQAVEGLNQIIGE